MILSKWSIIESQVFPGQDNNSEPNNQHLITMQHSPCAQNNLRKHYNSTVPAVIKYSDWDLILTPHWFPTAVLMSSMKMTRMPRRPRRMKRAMFSRSGVNYSWLTCNCVTVWCLMTLVPVCQSPSVPISLASSLISGLDSSSVWERHVGSLLAGRSQGVPGPAGRHLTRPQSGPGLGQLLLWSTVSVAVECHDNVQCLSHHITNTGIDELSSYEAVSLSLSQSPGEISRPQHTQVVSINVVS